ncbi:ferrous iron transport protein A [Caldicellulosiruptoraceae bacterium PP1]
MTLDSINKGQEVTIHKISKLDAKLFAYRLGINEGSKVKCIGKISNGPIIVRKNNQELAIGRNIAKNIEVK